MLAKLGSGLSGTLIFLAIVCVFLMVASIVAKKQRAAVKENGAAKNSKKKGSEALEQKIHAAIQSKETVDEELVAVITAAVAAMLGRPASGIIVKSIKKLELTVPIWTATGRYDQMNSRF